MFLIQNNVVGEENYFVFLCAGMTVKICHHNLHDFLIIHGLPREAGQGGGKSSKGIFAPGDGRPRGSGWMAENAKKKQVY